VEEKRISANVRKKRGREGERGGEKGGLAGKHPYCGGERKRLPIQETGAVQK